MPGVNILVTFWSRTGRTEKLALAAALGAVQAKANIRLRWLRETLDDRELDSVPEWQENRKRMSRDYVAPREDDYPWADGMLIAIPASLSPAASEFKTYLHGLAAAYRNGKLRAKAARLIVSSPTPSEGNNFERDNTAASALIDLLSGLSVTAVPPESGPSVDPVELARLEGRQLAEFSSRICSDQSGK